MLVSWVPFLFSFLSPSTARVLASHRTPHSRALTPSIQHTTARFTPGHAELLPWPANLLVPLGQSSQIHPRLGGLPAGGPQAPLALRPNGVSPRAGICPPTP